MRAHFLTNLVATRQLDHYSKRAVTLFEILVCSVLKKNKSKSDDSQVHVRIVYNYIVGDLTLERTE